MDFTEYRNSASEKARLSDLINLFPKGGISVLDVGARDGFISRLLVNHFSMVTALDLEEPSIEHERIKCVKGDITALQFTDNSFGLVFCAEVLEHILPPGQTIFCWPNRCTNKSTVVRLDGHGRKPLRHLLSRRALYSLPRKSDTPTGKNTMAESTHKGRFCWHARSKALSQATSQLDPFVAQKASSFIMLIFATFLSDQLEDLLSAAGVQYNHFR